MRKPAHARPGSTSLTSTPILRPSPRKPVASSQRAQRLVPRNSARTGPMWAHRQTVRQVTLLESTEQTPQTIPTRRGEIRCKQHLWATKRQPGTGPLETAPRNVLPRKPERTARQPQPELDQRSALTKLSRDFAPQRIAILRGPQYFVRFTVTTLHVMLGVVLGRSGIPVGRHQPQPRTA